MGRWALALLKNTPESVDDPSPESPETRQQIITLLNLAHSYGWGVAVIVGGRWGPPDPETGERELIIGEVIGGDEAHWRAFADRATPAHLAEATHLLQQIAEAA